MHPAPARIGPRRRRSISQVLGLLSLCLLVFAGTACQPTPTVPKPPPAVKPPPTIPVVPAVPTTKVLCVGSGSITVATTIAPKVKALLAAAYKDSLKLCGSGIRSTARQIELRKQNCGTTYYAIWEMPSGLCKPPTAIPGRSLHEKGLAVDFSACETRATKCYIWLAKNASTFGLKNLPSESWHWSTTGH